MKKNLFMDVAEKIIKENKYLIEEKQIWNINIQKFVVDTDNYKNLKKDKGLYYTIKYKEDILYKNQKALTKIIVKCLKNILNNYQSFKTLIIGLGNEEIIGDSLGVKTLKKIIATNQYNDFLTVPKVALFIPSVTSKTGIDSFSLIELLVKKMQPETIIIIDSLIAHNHIFLNSCIEISDTGIIPGGAILNNKAITKNTFGIPIIAIGACLIARDKDELLTKVNINEVIDNTSTAIADAINQIYSL